jgi:hypothetical protein
MCDDRTSWLFHDFAFLSKPERKFGKRDGSFGRGDLDFSSFWLFTCSFVLSW